jgi:hypothetical protein
VEATLVVVTAAVEAAVVVVRATEVVEVDWVLVVTA